MATTLIVGGGAIGMCLAWHLTRRGAGPVTLLERNQLTSGISWHAAGIVGPLRATATATRVAMYAGEPFPRLEEETGLSTGYRRTGSYWLAREAARMDELHRIAALGRHLGLDAAVVEPRQIAVPGLGLEGIVCALRIAEDASVNPVDLCIAYARQARTGDRYPRERYRWQAAGRERPGEGRPDCGRHRNPRRPHRHLRRGLVEAAGG